jgi:hypothetical protein
LKMDDVITLKHAPCVSCGCTEFRMEDEGPVCMRCETFSQVRS